MTDRPRNRIEHLFAEALQQPSERRRSEFLAESCGSDAAVKTRLEELLTAHERAGSFLETPVADLDEWGFVLKEEFIRHPGGPAPPAADTLGFLHPPERSDEIGSFSGYGVTQLLGRGGAGIVLKARDRRLNRIVALKVLAPEWAAQTPARQRFLREARAAAAVRHEHVVAIHAIDETASLPFLVMEYIAGESLQQRIARDGGLPIGEVLRIGREVAAGLAAAHAQRLVHRDVKPANILLEEATGRVRITDFGLARTEDDVGITQEGMIAGTPQYMSPEQATGDAIDFRSDLFSFGSVLYAMCAGRPPFEAENNLAVMRKICEAPPQPIGGLRPDTPPGLARLIGDLLEKDAVKRPQTADEVAERLDRIAGGSDAGRPVRGWSRRRIIVGGAIGAAAVAGAIAAFGPWNADDPGEASLPNPDSSKPAPSPPEHNQTLNAALFDPSVKPLSEFRRMSVPGKRIDSLAVSPDGLRIYAGASDGVIYVWDTRTGAEVQRYPGHRPVTNRILVSRDGVRMVTFGADRVMRVWNTTSGNETARVQMLIPSRGAALSPDGGEVVVSFYGGRGGAGIVKRLKRPTGAAARNFPEPVFDKLSIFSTVTGRRRRFLSAPRTDSYDQVDWSPDGRFIAAGTEDGRLLLFDAKTGDVRQERNVSGMPGPAYGVHFAQDGKRLFAAGSGNMIWGWTIPGFSIELRRRFQFGIVRFAVSGDNRWLGFGGRPEIRLLAFNDAAGSDVLLKLDGHTSAVHSVAFIPHADVLVSYGRDGTVRLWRLPADPLKLIATKEPEVRRLNGNDGFAIDANGDGVFESVDAKAANLYVTRPTGTFPREVALLEFDTRPHRDVELLKAVLEVNVNLTQSSNQDPTFEIDVHAYAADGDVTVADATASGVRVAQLNGDSKTLLGTLRIPLDVAVIRRLTAQSSHIGLRISNSRGNRLRLASRRYYVKESVPVLELHLRPRH